MGILLRGGSKIEALDVGGADFLRVGVASYDAPFDASHTTWRVAAKRESKTLASRAKPDNAGWKFGRSLRNQNQLGQHPAAAGAR